MTEPLPEPRPPETAHPAVDPDAALARKNLIWGIALFAFVVILFGATILVAFIYLALD
jgi:hypothetical protein